MQTLKLMVVLGLGASAVAIGLAYAWAALSGGTVGGDEIARHVVISLVVMGCAVGVLRRRPPPAR